jgi:hypothetical protein
MPHLYYIRVPHGTARFWRRRRLAVARLGTPRWGARPAAGNEAPLAAVGDLRAAGGGQRCPFRYCC